MKIKGAMGVLKRDMDFLGFKSFEAQMSWIEKHTLGATNRTTTEAIEIFRRHYKGYYVYKNLIIKWGKEDQPKGVKITHDFGEYNKESA